MDVYGTILWVAMLRMVIISDHDQKYVIKWLHENRTVAKGHFDIVEYLEHRLLFIFFE